MTRAAAQRPDEIRKATRAVVSLFGLVALGATAGIYSVKHGNLALILSGIFLAASFLLLKDTLENMFGTYRWIPYAWVALCLAPDFRFTYRSTLQNSVSSATLENFAQVAIYMLVAALVLRSRRLLVAQDPRHLRKGPVLAWPLIALVSTAWSLVPLFTFVRALQLFVPIGLALLMVRIWLRSPEVGRAIWNDTLRLFVQAVTILVLIGFATGFWREPRFSWPGMHPGTAAIYIGTALLILVAGGRSFLGFRAWGYALRIALFGIAMYLGDTRGALAGFLLALGVTLWFAARTKPLKSYLGLTYYAIGIGLALVAAQHQIMQYALRGAKVEGITSLNGRIPLWGDAIELLSDANRWFVGFGYGSARVILPKVVEWAGTAHSSWVELLLSIGIVGPLLLATDVFFVLRHAASRYSIVPPSLTVSILALVVATSITGEGLAFAGLSFGLLALLHVPVLVETNSMGQQVSKGTVAASADVAASRGTRPTLQRSAGGSPPSQ